MKLLALFVAASIATGVVVSDAHASLTITINTLTTNEFSFTLAGTFDADVIGDQTQFLAIKNDWSNNFGVQTELFSALPTITLNTIQIGGLASATAVGDGLSGWHDYVQFSNPLGVNTPILAGTGVSGSLTLTGLGIFDPLDIATLELVSGFVPVMDWARFEILAVPEPTSAVLVGIGLAGLGVGGRA